MEQLDERLAHAVQDRMRHSTRARVFSSRDLNASQMTSLLRGLDVLMTSRYHASVLSLAAAVPQMAVGHDLRLKTLYHELGLDEYCVAPGPDMWPHIQAQIEKLLDAPQPVQSLLRTGHAAHLASAQRNRALLQAFVIAHGFAPSGVICAAAA
jgi:polysaccharide pyruvyl transferase WcaK-like protein